MPVSLALPNRICGYPGCDARTPAHYCEPHMRAMAKTLARQRLSSHARGYDGRWRMYRFSFLLQNPLCVECLKENVRRAATDVDHIIPHKGDAAVFWDVNNHQALCKSHHSAKTAREGRWG